MAPVPLLLLVKNDEEEEEEEAAAPKGLAAPLWMTFGTERAGRGGHYGESGAKWKIAGAAPVRIKRPSSSRNKKKEKYFAGSISIEIP